MLRLASYDIVFQEIPGEVTLALNLANCPNRCEGCHSPHLREDRGEVLDEAVLVGLTGQYGRAITCVCFMGGDADPWDVERYSVFLKHHTGGRIKTGWYSGRDTLPEGLCPGNFDYIKLGSYRKEFGGLRSRSTNQRLYRIVDGEMVDATDSFWKKNR